MELEITSRSEETDKLEFYALILILCDKSWNKYGVGSRLINPQHAGKQVTAQQANTAVVQIIRVYLRHKNVMDWTCL